MKFMHISDLHLGKRLNTASLINDQRYILEQITRIAEENKVDCMLIAGDVFDEGNSTSAESVTLLDDFLTGLSELGIRTYMISGNHDSMDRLEFGSRMFSKNNLFISSTFKGYPERFEVNDGGKTMGIYLLPFVKPAHVRQFYPETPSDFNSALNTVFAHANLGKEDVRILVTHQYVVSGTQYPETCDSERKYIGGEEAVSADLFEDFDYVALGHIHSPQTIGRETVRYCGAPLKYTGSVMETDKSVTIIDTAEGISITEVPLRPLHDIRIIKGPLDKLLEMGKNDPCREDYIFAVVQGDSMSAMARMREVYPNTMHLSFENDLKDDAEIAPDIDLEHLDINDEFAKFFKSKTEEELTESQKKMVKELFDKMEVVL